MIEVYKILNDHAPPIMENLLCFEEINTILEMFN